MNWDEDCPVKLDFDEFWEFQIWRTYPSVASPAKFPPASFASSQCYDSAPMAPGEVAGLSFPFSSLLFIFLISILLLPGQNSGLDL